MTVNEEDEDDREELCLSCSEKLTNLQKISIWNSQPGSFIRNDCERKDIHSIATMNKPFGRGFISTAGASPAAPPVMPPPTRSPPLLLVKRTGGAGGLSSSLDMVSSALFQI
uniref:Uncharacterized protein n=1 Tax=Glossina austeni TaxID=7395 RepID=A0A1A9UQW9_GLOAU